MEDKEKEYIILHEKHHIHRMDHIVKALVFLAFCIHWFNPLVWAAFHFSTKDMEMSCDEAVIKKMGEEIRADQSYNTMNFIVKGDVIICGYGFTDEKDYLYQINRNTGEIIDRIELKKMPDLLVEQDGKLYVHTYSYNYVIEFDEGGVEEQQKEAGAVMI